MPDTTVLQMDNPLMTQARGMTLWSQLRSLPAYTPAEVRWRGNPCVQPGDIIRFEATAGNFSQHVVTTQKLHFAGGFCIDSTCPGIPITLNEINRKTSIDKQLNSASEDIREEVDEATGELKAAVSNLEERSIALERRMAQVSADADMATSAAAEAGEAAARAQREINSLSNDVVSLEDGLLSLSGDVDTLDIEVGVISDSVDALDGRLTAAERLLSGMAAEHGGINYDGAEATVALPATPCVLLCGICSAPGAPMSPIILFPGCSAVVDAWTVSLQGANITVTGEGEMTLWYAAIQR